MSQNGQRHFKVQDFSSVSDHSGALCIKGLNMFIYEDLKSNLTEIPMAQARI